MNAQTVSRVVVAVVLTASVGTAQQPVPIRQVTTIEAVSSETVGALSGLRELSDGRVIANDVGKRRLLLFDRALATSRVIADTTSGTKAQYGSRATAIIAYAGDSTLLVDVAGRGFLVIDSSGKVVRVMSAPRPNDVPMIAAGGMGAPAFDRGGRLVYRTMIMPAFKAPVVGKPYTPPVVPDSAPLLRADFDTRSADTIAWLRVNRMKVKTTFLPNGGVTLTPIIAPVSTIDDWTALPDGSIAILRGTDYHIDWIAADGSRSTSPKMPFDWKRLSDEEKVAMIDSAKKALERQAQAEANGSAGRAPGMAAPAGGHGGMPPTGAARHSMTIMPVGGDDGVPPPQSANKGPAIPAVAEVVAPTDLPDYYPPILQPGLMKADFRGNVWILPATTAHVGRGLLYDVVNRKGELVERVRLPEGRTLEGFGLNGAIYLTSHGPGGARLERARLQ